MIRENKYPVMDLIYPQHVLISVFDKKNLNVIIDGILQINPKAIFYSTGGTGKKIKEILGHNNSSNYMSVEDFTGAPEMEGGLVKTLHPKIHAGLLAERNNPAHEKYLIDLEKIGSGPGVYFDIFIGNLYPFSEVVSMDTATSETARVNIDIGGPTMAMAAAKNWHSIAVLTSPDQYPDFANYLQVYLGINLRQRFFLAQEAFKVIGNYRMSIASYFNRIDFYKDVETFIKLEEG